MCVIIPLPTGRQRTARLLKRRYERSGKGNEPLFALLNEILIDYMDRRITQDEMERRVDAALPHVKVI